MEIFQNEAFVAIFSRIAVFLGIVLGTLVLGYIFNRLFRRFIIRSTLIMNTDPTNYQFLRHFLTAVVYLIGFSLAIYSVPSLRALAGSLLAGAGILAVAIGFASQQALSNIVSGLFIVVFKPFRVNDRLRIRDTLSGVVEDITLRHTVIRDFENRRIIIPNTVISNEVIINADFLDDKICKWFEINITLDSDVALAKTILREEALKHPLRLDIRTQEEIEAGKEELQVRLIHITPYAMTLRAWIWAKDSADAFNLNCDLLESVKARFDAAGIQIPNLGVVLDRSV